MSFRDNKASSRYELDHPDGPSIARYQDGERGRAILHVETPEAARGRGYAGLLMEAMVADARLEGRKLTPVCGYASAWFARHAQARDVLS